MRAIILWVFLKILTVHADGWVDPYFTATDDPRVKKVSDELVNGFGQVVLLFDENVEIGFTLGELNNPGSTPITSSDEFKIVENGGKYLVQNTRTFDYEKDDDRETNFAIRTQNNDIVNFKIHINNINDNPFVIVKRDPCEIKENTLDVSPPCIFLLKDKDGLSGDLEFNNFDPEYAEIFEFSCEDVCTGEKEANVKMTLKRQLDYEDVERYIFDWTVNDDVDNDYVRVQVNVIDQPDQPPEWKTIKISNQFDEETEQTFTFLAEDGDKGVNDEILYSCYDEDPPLNVLMTCDKVDKSLQIKVKPIDRDEDDLSTLKFTVNACEKNLPEECTPETINFIINDINDNVPKITLKSPPDLVLDENKYQTIDLEFEIKDLDLGDFGTFYVDLKCEDAERVEKAMQVIPNVGYRTGTFTISIIAADILDYDRTDDLRDFHIQIVTVEKFDETHTCSVSVRIRLTNWNDEEPEFEEDNYSVTVPETFGRVSVESLNIDNLFAIDLDVDDEVKYALIGSGINNILELAYDDILVIIRSIKQSDPSLQLFDYEKQEVVNFQLEASDNFKLPGNTIKHKTFAEITVNLIDVNDETPHITLSTSSIEIDENRPEGFELPNLIVTATDADRTAQLKVEIDWTESYATKYGQRKEIFQTKYKNSFELVPVTNYDTEVKFTIQVRDVMPQNTPDFEEFDTIYLRILVTDEDQEIPVNTNQATLVITVKDLNDNKPQFVEEVMNEPRSVKENSEPDTTIGMVAATDLDVNSDLTFSLEEKGDTPGGLVDIDNKNRVIKVVGEIDAEDLFYNKHIKSLSYKITVSDEKHEDYWDLEIEVKDVNDELPKFDVTPVDQTIKEHSAVGDTILQIEASDRDRDEPNCVISYSFEESETDKYFHISETGLITVNTDIDRDGPDGDHSFDVIVVLKDNPTNGKDVNTEKSKIIKFTIQDINDQKPEIKTTKIETREDVGVGNALGTVIAEDLDEPGSDNAKVDFEIVELIGCYDQLNLDFFEIKTDDDKTSQKGTIYAKKDLKGFFTDCTIRIKTHDFGTDPEQQEDEKSLNLVIDKYNYEDPVFKFPTKNSIYLKPVQAPNQRVQLYDGTPLEAIRAEHKRPEKYGITFSLHADSEGKDTFDFIPETSTTAYLTLKPNYDNTKSYNVKIVAKDDGEPSREVVKDIKIGFYDTDKEPVFKEDDRNVNFTFEETEAGVGETLQLPEASLDVDDEGIVGELDIYYYIYEDLNKAFTVDKLAGLVTLEKPIFVLNLASDVLKVVAAKSPINYPSEVSPESIVTVNLIVIDINDNAPVFNQSQYSSGVMVSYDKTRIIVEVAAYDLDTNDVLSYSILEDTYKAVGENINANLHKFNLDSESGEIKLGFEVQQNMKGYFDFDVNVSDTLFTDTTNVKIYIISDDNEVAIRFENDFEDITKRKFEIQQILSDFLDYDCSVHGVSVAADENGNDIDGVTEVKTHCVDRKTNLPINKDDIKVQINTVEMIGIFRQNLFFISSVKDVIIPENMEEQLKIWLISVSVVLGSFCVLLIVAFIVKTKSLMVRINKLTTVEFADDEKRAKESALQVPSAPNTNRRAVEGSNPVFNSNFEDRVVNDYDKKSISSDDSDFLGIENNPVFDD